jgi:hypothetical protein
MFILHIIQHNSIARHVPCRTERKYMHGNKKKSVVCYHIIDFAWFNYVLIVVVLNNNTVDTQTADCRDCV